MKLEIVNSEPEKEEETTVKFWLEISKFDDDAVNVCTVGVNGETIRVVKFKLNKKTDKIHLELWSFLPEWFENGNAQQIKIV